VNGHTHDLIVIAGQVRIDSPALQRFKRSFTDPVPERREQTYVRQGIDAMHGRVRFTGRNSVTVAGRTLTARHIAIAAGAEPVRLPIEGLELLSLSDDFQSPAVERRATVNSPCPEPTR
jgi:glutathione reductase (NADPH)